MAKNLEKAPKATPATLAERTVDSAEPTSTSAVTVDSIVSDSIGKYLSPLHHDALPFLYSLLTSPVPLMYAGA